MYLDQVALIIPTYVARSAARGQEDAVVVHLLRCRRRMPAPSRDRIYTVIVIHLHVRCNCASARLSRSYTYVSAVVVHLRRQQRRNSGDGPSFWEALHTKGPRYRMPQLPLTATMRNATPATTKSRIEIHAREMHAHEMYAYESHP